MLGKAAGHGRLPLATHLVGAPQGRVQLLGLGQAGLDVGAHRHALAPRVRQHRRERHVDHVAHGPIEEPYGRRVRSRGHTWVVHRDERGFRYELTPPVPIEIAKAMVEEAATSNRTWPRCSSSPPTPAPGGASCARCGGGTSTNRPARSGSKRRIGETSHVYERDTKTHQRRAVTLSSFALDWLLDHRDRHAKACALCGIELSDDAYVLAPEPGGLKPLHPSSATRAFSRLRDRMDLPTGIHLHGLRHLQVTQLLDAGVPLRSVSGRVGHRNPSTTTNIYAHWIQESDSRAASAVDDRIWGVGG